LKILIVKTSSLGDIIQSFNVLNYLHSKFNDVQIDWVVEKASISLVRSHPLISHGICYDMKVWKKSFFKKRSWVSFFCFIRFLRKKRYDIVFDLQGNCKSGLVSFFAKSKTKVGFGVKSVREWPNLLATNVHIDVDLNINMRLQYLQLVTKYFSDDKPFAIKGCRLKISNVQKNILNEILQHLNLQTDTKIMVCFGAKWPNKQLSYETLLSFLKRLQEDLNASFLLIWGNDYEKVVAQKLNQEFQNSSLVIDKISIPMWQNLMNDVDLVIAMDSSSLHLCGTIETYSFSVFGPTKKEVFLPLGENHFAYQGKCPYNIVFKKQCSDLRTCVTGACIRYLKSDDIYSAFSRWWESKKNTCKKSQ
jgi:heptosyltransferase-1